MKKRVLCMSILVILLFSLTGCLTVRNSSDPVNETIPANGFGDLETGAVIAVGMSKEEIESQFDDWEIEETDYTYYVFNGLSVTYNEKDKADFVYIDRAYAAETETVWETRWGIKIGSSLEEAVEKYGDYSKIRDAYVFTNRGGELWTDVDDNDIIKNMFFYGL